MRFREIVRRPATTDSHPFVTDIAIDPAAFDDFERAMEDRQGVRLLARSDRPDVWVVHVACTTEMIRAGLRRAWG